MANPGPAVTDKLYAFSFANTIGEDEIFLTVADYSPKLVEDPCTMYMIFAVGLQKKLNMGAHI